MYRRIITTITLAAVEMIRSTTTATMRSREIIELISFGQVAGTTSTIGQDRTGYIEIHQMDISGLDNGEAEVVDQTAPVPIKEETEAGEMRRKMREMDRDRLA